MSVATHREIDLPSEVKKILRDSSSWNDVTHDTLLIETYYIGHCLSNGAVSFYVLKSAQCYFGAFVKEVASVGLDFNISTNILSEWINSSYSILWGVKEIHAVMDILLSTVKGYLKRN